MKANLHDWNIEDRLATPEKRAFYLEAAIEEAAREDDMGFLAVALGDVARAVGGGSVAVFMSGLSVGMRAAAPRHPSARADGTGRRGAARAAGKPVRTRATTA